MSQHGAAPDTLVYAHGWCHDPALPGAPRVGLSDAVQLDLRP